MSGVEYSPVTIAIGGVDTARFKAIREVAERRFPQGVLFRRVDVPVNNNKEFKTGFRAAESTVRTMVTEAHQKVPHADFVVGLDTRIMGESRSRATPFFVDRAVAMVKNTTKGRRGISRSSIGFIDSAPPSPTDRHTQYVDALDTAFDRAK